MLKVYENLSDFQFLKGNYTQSEYFHKKAFQTIKESESFGLSKDSLWDTGFLRFTA